MTDDRSKDWERLQKEHPAIEKTDTQYRVEMVEKVRKVYFVDAADEEEAKEKAKANDDCTVLSGETHFTLIAIGPA
jgi:bisphosphoglycerate-independent phosphoglycerate mutase (AlkP superfamily)|tara:strand:- start:415 stop:642 length:228 start_codon:yes stop_codon:yes gene_type:complete